MAKEPTSLWLFWSVPSGHRVNRARPELSRDHRERCFAVTPWSIRPCPGGADFDPGTRLSLDSALPDRHRRAQTEPAQQHVSEMHKRHLIFSALLIGSIAVFAAPIRDLVRLSLGDERYSHLLLIPPLAALLLCLKGRTAFQTPNYSPRVGATVLGLGAGLSILAWLAPTRPGTTWLAQDVHLSAQTSALLVIWMAAFLLCYGARAFRQAIFPLLFLFLVVPLPTVVVDKAVIALQHGSAAVTYGLFKLMQIPVLAQGVRLSLPGVDIEIAQECSGIRSSESLVITSILAGYFLLHSAWTRTWLIALTVPIAILKNATSRCWN